MFGGRLIVRVGAVGVDADVGAVVPNQAFVAHGRTQPLHVVELGVWASARAHSAANHSPALGQNRVDGPLRDPVAGDLFFTQDRLKNADKVSRTYNPLAQPAQKLDRAGVHHRDVHDVIVGRVLHGQRARSRQHRLQAGGQFLPTGVESLGARQRVQPALFYSMHQLARLARGGHKVVPAGRDVRLLVQAQNVRGDGVAVMMVVKEPAVKVGFADGGLNRLKVHTGHFTRRNWAVREAAESVPET